MQADQQHFDFVESINDALACAVRALGGPKKVGQMLKPEKTIHDASVWVTDCLNPDRASEFHPEHVQFLLRESRAIGDHSAMNFICADAGYSTPIPIEPEDEKSKLMREFVAATEQQRINIERLERLSKAARKVSI